MKIWCRNQFADIDKENGELLRQLISKKYCPESTFRIAIVGGGPKGVYAVERLASMWSHYFPERIIDIVVFNKTTAFASGPNYDPQQPDYLLMNYPLGKVNFWTDEPLQLTKGRQNLHEFLKDNLKNSQDIICTEDYNSRALTGVYLQHCLVKLIKSLPATIRLHLIADTVKSIEVSNSQRVSIKTTLGTYNDFAEVLCCTGHSYRFVETDSKSVPKEKVQQPYPVGMLETEDFSGKTLLIKGLGLTFVDTLLALTQGRGGSFYRCRGRLCYQRSGREPQKVYAFSRTGLPMIPRQKEPLNIPLQYFTREITQKLLRQSVKVDFSAEILPLLEKEYRYRYARLYSRFAGKHFPGSMAVEELEGMLSDADPTFAPLDFNDFLTYPLRQANQHAQIKHYLEATVFPYAECVALRARLALTTLWREISPYFSRMYAFGKMTGDSQRLFDKAYRPSLQRISYGPPQVSMEKVIALVEAGFLDFGLAVDPYIDYDRATDKVIAKSKNGELTIQADVMVDARVAVPGNISSQPEYVQQIIETVGATFFTNQHHQTGCLDMTSEGRLKVAPNISFYGTPTEGCTFDNESLSRHNNNLLTPWTQYLVETYANNAHSKAHADHTSLD